MFANIETVKQAAIELMTSDREGATEALNIALNILENKMSESEFVAFCEAM